MKALWIILMIIPPGLIAQPVIQWQKTIGGNSYDSYCRVLQTSDSGYIIGGGSVSNASGDKSENKIGGMNEDFWIVKLNSTGAIQWENTIGGNLVDEFFDFTQTFDGGYLIGGSSTSGISGDKTSSSRGGFDYWIIKLNAAGVVQWDKTIGGYNNDWLYSIVPTFDGGYMLGGYTSSDISWDKTENSKGLDDYWVVKIDSLGNIQWQKTIGGNANDLLSCIKQTSDGGYIIGGTSESTISGDKTDSCRGDRDFWIVKIDSIGGIQWQKTIGGNRADFFSALQPTTDNGYIAIGSSHTLIISGDKTENNCNMGDIWIIKLDSIGSIQWQNTIGSYGNDGGRAVQQTSDGGYIIGCYTNGGVQCDKTDAGQGGSDYWVLKLDTLGNIQWQKDIGGSNTDNLLSMQLTNDGGFILSGDSYSNISGDKTENHKGACDYWIVKLSTTVGIEEVSNPVIMIYPNPVDDKLNFYSNINTIKATAEIYDMLGRKIYDYKIEASDQENTFDVSSLAPGVYALVINFKGYRSTSMFVKE